MISRLVYLYRNNLKNWCLIALFLPTFSFNSLHAKETTKKTDQESSQQETKTADIAKLSEAFGHLIAKNMETAGVEFDIAKVIQGIQNAHAGQTSPMTEGECVQAITTAQESFYKKQAIDNLKKADEFLVSNKKNKGIVSIENGKIQYKVEKEGKGAKVAEHGAPLIKYVGKFADGTVFGASKEAEVISLDETIAGISKGLIGMKEGEKRTLYIHPSLAYGTTGPLPPNSLLSFEVELVKVDPPKVKESVGSSSERSSQEIAIPQVKTEAVR